MDCISDLIAIKTIPQSRIARQLPLHKGALSGDSRIVPTVCFHPLYARISLAKFRLYAHSYLFILTANVHRVDELKLAAVFIK